MHLPDEPVSDEVERHLATCADCRAVADTARRLDTVLRSAVLVEPPQALQDRLMAIALEMPLIVPAASEPVATPRPPWTKRFTLDHRAAAAVFAGSTAGLAAWQVASLLANANVVVGDILHAAELVATSPASSYVGALGIDLPGLAAWSSVAIGVWLLSSAGSARQRATQKGA